MAFPARFGDFSQAVLVPGAGQVAFELQLEGRIEFLDEVSADLAQIGRLPFDRQPASEASAREIENLSDHSGHSFADANDARGRLCVLLVEVAAPKQRGGRHDDRRERVTQVVPEDADEHLPELRHLTELALAPLCALPGLVSLVRQLVRPNRCDDHLLVRFALVDEQPIGVAPFAGQVLVGGSALGCQRLGPAELPRRTLAFERSISVGSLALEEGAGARGADGAFRRLRAFLAGNGVSRGPQEPVGTPPGDPQQLVRRDLFVRDAEVGLLPFEPKALVGQLAFLVAGRCTTSTAERARCASTSAGFPSAARQAIVSSSSSTVILRIVISLIPPPFGAPVRRPSYPLNASQGRTRPSDGSRTPSAPCCARWSAPRRPSALA